ncbi:MAG: hypothetical protein HY868_12905 [Chloroflexi bacterium]|nr:hypothetical protein [Chloroflexota bacterium]
MRRSTAGGLARLPRLDETWLIATAQLRTWVAPPDEKPYRPYIIITFNADDGAMRGTELVPGSPTPRQVWDALSNAARHPTPNSGKPGAPQRLVVSDSALAEKLLAFFADAKLEIDLIEAPMPDEVRDIIRELETHMRQGTPENPALVAVPNVSPELIASFYAAAAEFYRAAPWVQLSNYHALALRHPYENEFRYAIVMGQGGVEYGLAMYPTWDNVRRTFTEDDNPLDAIPAEGLHSCFFDDATKMPFDDLDAIEKFGWAIAAPNAYPIVVVVEKARTVRRPTRAELLWYEVALRAIPMLVRDHLKPNGRGDFEPIEMTLYVPTHAGTLQVAVKYPAGDLPLAEQPAQRVEWADFEGDVEKDDEPRAFDRRVMERPMQELARQMGRGETSESALDRAQDLMYDAFEETNPAKRIALAHDALTISADCADAYVLLAQEEADTLQRAMEYYAQGVAAGARALGKEFFAENAGHFWGLLETRPYMRARHGLAETLWRLNRQEDALAHYREMLRLNPNDNQGIRYLLVDLLLQLERDEEIAPLLKQYHDDWSATWQYTRALLAFRKHGATARANKALADALEENPHVPAYLTGRKRVPNRLPDLIGMGDEREAIAYAADHLNYWRRTPGAVEWLNAHGQAPKKPVATQARPRRAAARKRKPSR